ncbi:MAG: FHA domain-containing protein [Pyrinomonadaceae bacterium]
MQIEATLTFTDENGRTRSAVVNARHFSIDAIPKTISRSLIPTSPASTLIECFDDFLQITDCGSQNGTAVNGAPVVGAVELRAGDVITLGRALALKVGVRAAVAPAHATSLPAASSASDASGAHQAAKSLTANNQPRSAWWMSVPVLAATAAAVFVLLAAVVLLVVSRDHRRSPREWRGAQQENRKKPEDPQRSSALWHLRLKHTRRLSRSTSLQLPRRVPVQPLSRVTLLRRSHESSVPPHK